MSTLDAFLLGEDSQRHHLQQQRQQQQRSTVRSDVISWRMNPLQDMHLANQSNRIATTSANIASLIFVSEYAILTYKISLGFICACLCLLTVSGNLLVLITFRRIRTVSISLGVFRFKNSLSLTPSFGITISLIASRDIIRSTECHSNKIFCSARKTRNLSCCRDMSKETARACEERSLPLTQTVRDFVLGRIENSEIQV